MSVLSSFGISKTPSTVFFFDVGEEGRKQMEIDGRMVGWE